MALAGSHLIARIERVSLSRPEEFSASGTPLPEIKCAVHEGLRDVAHDFQPGGPLAQSLRR